MILLAGSAVRAQKFPHMKPYYLELVGFVILSILFSWMCKNYKDLIFAYI